MAAMTKSHVDSIFPLGTTDDSAASADSAAPRDTGRNDTDAYTNALIDDNSENDWDGRQKPHSEFDVGAKIRMTTMKTMMMKRRNVHLRTIPLYWNGAKYVGKT